MEENSETAIHGITDRLWASSPPGSAPRTVASILGAAVSSFTWRSTIGLLSLLSADDGLPTSLVGVPINEQREWLPKGLLQLDNRLVLNNKGSS